MGPGERFKNIYKLLNLGARKFSLMDNLNNVWVISFFMYEQDIFCGVANVPFEIPHKISYPYIVRDDFFIQYWKFKSFQIYELVSLCEMLRWTQNFVSRCPST